MNALPRALALLLALPLALSGCGGKSADPAPAPPAVAGPARGVTYADGSGRTLAVGTFSAYSVTATPSATRLARRAVVVRVLLPDGRTLDVTYTYLGAAFPTGNGTIKLDEAPMVSTAGGSQANPTRYQAAGVTTGTLTADAGGAESVSGTYAGPLTAGGPAVSLTFTRLTF